MINFKDNTNSFNQYINNHYNEINQSNKIIVNYKKSINNHSHKI